MAQKRNYRKTNPKGGEQEIGLVLGGSYTFLIEDERISGVDYGKASGVRGLIGISFHRQINRTFFTHANFLVELGEYQVQFKDSDDDLSYTATYSNYALFPVLFGLGVPNTDFFVNAGPFVGTHLTKSLHAHGFLFETQQERSFTLGLSGGIGYARPITRELKVSAELRHNYGLANFNEDPINFKLSSTQLLVGLRYSLPL